MTRRLLFGFNGVELSFLALALLLLVVLAWYAVRRIRQGHGHGWDMIWWSVAACLLFGLYRPFYHRLRPSLAHWPALLVALVVNLLWVAYGARWIARELEISRREKAARK